MSIVWLLVLGYFIIGLIIVAIKLYMDFHTFDWNKPMYIQKRMYWIPFITFGLFWPISLKVFFSEYRNFTSIEQTKLRNRSNKAEKELKERGIV